MMDETVEFPLAQLPMSALTLRLARPLIRMRHDESWSVDKVNPVHDLIVCLQGSGTYRIGETEEEMVLSEGEAILVPAFTRFRGRPTGDGLYLGMAQHFSLEMFGKGDLIDQMELRSKARLPEWEIHGGLARLMRESAPLGRTTLIQHYHFMSILMAYLQEAFVGWHEGEPPQDSQDRLSLHIMFVASQLASDPLGWGAEVDEVVASVPYNAEYFRRAFRQKLGLTPQKYRERKRMEFAADRLSQGLTVKETAAELGYTDPYFFSRMFKRHIGQSPSAHRLRPGDAPEPPLVLAEED